MNTPHITRIADLRTQRESFPAKSYVAHWRPVEEFERPIKGDPDEAREVHGQRMIFVYFGVGLAVWVVAWWGFLSSMVGVR